MKHFVYVILGGSPQSENIWVQKVSSVLGNKILVDVLVIIIYKFAITLKSWKNMKKALKYTL